MESAPFVSRERPRGQDGLVLVCVLLAMALLTVICAGFARRAMHTAPPVFARAQPEVTGWMQAMASPPEQLGTETTAQSHELLTLSGREQVSLVPRGDGTDLLQLGAASDGLPRRLARAQLQPSLDLQPGEPLPTLPPALMQTLLGDTALQITRLSGTTLWQDADIHGLVVLSPGAVLYLDDVVIDGCLLSEAALRVGAPDPSTVPPQVVVDGDLRIEPGPALPGLAVLMPDGVLRTASADPAVQIGGDIVVSRLVLGGHGALLGNVAALHPVECSARIARPGEARAPRAWSPVLDLGDVRRAVSVVFVPPDAPPEVTAPGT